MKIFEMFGTLIAAIPGLFLTFYGHNFIAAVLISMPMGIILGLAIVILEDKGFFK